MPKDSERCIQLILATQFSDFELSGRSPYKWSIYAHGSVFHLGKTRSLELGPGRLLDRTIKPRPSVASNVFLFSFRESAVKGVTPSFGTNVGHRHAILRAQRVMTPNVDGTATEGATN